ncbi:DUF1697 domain-containing protein [Endozoicomonas sp. G2_1]|uniref:DUF1697 domain-containing protein n=1 Tax=Endozoicomonas sp. G2_1 TaxID=2821091 RepID=UPI001ADB12B4|nr:DUF1697 domain-containing protein [Endozoicomonas sp. G2_1]MBO9489825.1 DUF1697 domain-containing protein [Endozoicomonas sp. G2_1]
MARYFALLRGINVGKHNVLSMEKLKKTFEKEQCENVSTYIRSGNALFDYQGIAITDLAQKLTEQVSDIVGALIPVRIFPCSLLMTTLEGNPFKEKIANQVHAFFNVEEEQSFPHEELNKLLLPSEQLVGLDDVMYLHAPEGLKKSKMIGKVEKLMGGKVTVRNLNTLNKMANLI